MIKKLGHNHVGANFGEDRSRGFGAGRGSRRRHPKK